MASTVRQDPPVSDGDPGSEQDARGASRTRTVASLATALADAVLAGDLLRGVARGAHRVLGGLDEVLHVALTGIVFGVLTLRQYKLARSLTAAVELVHIIQTPEFARSLEYVLRLPENAEPRRVLEDAEMRGAADVLTHGFESLGILVYYRILPLHLADNLIGGSVRACWRRLHVHSRSVA